MAFIIIIFNIKELFMLSLQSIIIAIIKVFSSSFIVIIINIIIKIFLGQVFLNEAIII